jgi:uncharacterized membrane protein YphA (DoxX/SURF4 family)
LFPAFPAGWPGRGLLLLRLVAGGTAMLEGASLLTVQDAGLLDAAVGIVTILAGGALLLGVLAPIAGALVAVGAIGLATSLVRKPPQHPLDDPSAIVLLTAVSVAIVLLGPGALSIDSYLFGRREIVIRPDARSLDND